MTETAPTTEVTSEPTPVVEPTAAATTAEATQPSEAADQEISYSEWKAKRDGVKPSEPAAAQPEPKPSSDNAPAATLAPDVAKVIQRFNLTPEDYAALPPQAQARLHKTLDKWARKYDEAFAQRTVEPQQQVSPPPATPAASEQAEDDAVVKEFAEEFGPEWAKKLAALADLRAKSILKPVEQQLEALRQERQQQQLAKLKADFEQGYAALELPEGIDPNDEDVKNTLRVKATKLLQAEGYDPDSNNYGHALKQAAAALYHDQYLAAARQARVTQQKKSLRGSPTMPASRNPQPVPATEDEAERQWFEARRRAAGVA